METRISTPSEVISMVLLVFESREIKLTHEDLMSKSRQCHIIDARYMIFFILHQKMGYPLTYIAKMFDKNHATVLHGSRAANNRIKFMKLYNSIYNEVASFLNLPPDIIPPRPKVKPIEKPKPAKKKSEYVKPKNWTKKEQATLKAIEKKGGFGPFTI